MLSEQPLSLGFNLTARCDIFCQLPTMDKYYGGRLHEVDAFNDFDTPMQNAPLSRWERKAILHRAVAFMRQDAERAPRSHLM